MTVLEQIEAAVYLRDQARQAIARYTIEIRAMSDYLVDGSPNNIDQYHHAWERGVYAGARQLAQDLRELELSLAMLESERESQP